MTHDDALHVLRLQPTSNAEAVERAVAALSDELESRRDSAPTDALREKYESELERIREAGRVLLERPSVPGLSQTQFADLPGAAPSYTIGDAGSDQAGSRLTIAEGQVLAGRYEIRERIGAGGMGAVFRAYDRNRAEEIAIKVLLPGLLERGSAKERFLGEARLSSALSHPGIVNVFDVQNDGELFFLTMELLEGRTLREEMQEYEASRKPFPVPRAIEIVRALCEALAYAHETTVHRDVKPENVFITADGKIKLMDFGIARVMSASQLTMTGASMGTAYYMAPEQLKGAKEVDGRADQYSLGVLLYEMLSGDVPAGRVRALVEVRPDVEKGLSLAVDRALEVKPEGRFADVLSLAKAFSGKNAKRDTQKAAVGVGSNGRRWLILATVLTVLASSGAFAFRADLLAAWRESQFDQVAVRDARANAESARDRFESEARGAKPLVERILSSQEEPLPSVLFSEANQLAESFDGINAIQKFDRATSKWETLREDLVERQREVADEKKQREWRDLDELAQEVTRIAAPLAPSEERDQLIEVAQAESSAAEHALESMDLSEARRLRESANARWIEARTHAEADDVRERGQVRVALARAINAKEDYDEKLEEALELNTRLERSLSQARQLHREDPTHSDVQSEEAALHLFRRSIKPGIERAFERADGYRTARSRVSAMEEAFSQSRKGARSASYGSQVEELAAATELLEHGAAELSAIERMTRAWVEANDALKPARSAAQDVEWPWGDSGNAAVLDWVAEATTVCEAAFEAGRIEEARLKFDERRADASRLIAALAEVKVLAAATFGAVEAVRESGLGPEDGAVKFVMDRGLEGAVESASWAQVRDHAEPWRGELAGFADALGDVARALREAEDLGAFIAGMSLDTQLELLIGQARAAVEVFAAGDDSDARRAGVRALEQAARSLSELLAGPREQLEQLERHTVSLDDPIELVRCPAGPYTMGSPPSEPGRDSDEDQREVMIEVPFEIGVTEVTQGQWEEVMGDKPWLGEDRVALGSRYPAVYVSHDGAVEFCKKLTARERRKGLSEKLEYRLPTEEEWEYACRAGTKTAYSFGDDEGLLDAYAVCSDLELRHAATVKTKRPNPWGVYDMHGNVAEWTSSPSWGGPGRVHRGGGWRYHARYCRSAFRNLFDPGARSCDLGFRVVLAPSSD